MANPFHTIGHARRPIAEFIDLLSSAEIGIVVDVRTVPRSRANPQYGIDVLPPALSEALIGYEHIAALGGLRGRQRQVPPDVNGFWENDSFHNYADYAMSEAFHQGLAHLRAIGRARRCVIMCAETVWWRCHRRIIADYLLAAGENVLHILGPGRIEPAQLTAAAQRGPADALIYPAVA